MLLDAGNTCKVSDFGMSATLAGDVDDNYASNYVRLQGELPVRWSAVEVLEEAKYSRASDVWSFGVLVWEAMSYGQQPFSELATLAEVSGRVKEGYRLKCPDGCSNSVYDNIMMPCWEADPSCRPGFTELINRLQDLGVVSTCDTDLDPTIRPALKSPPLESPSARRRRPSIMRMAEPEEWRLRGISLHHLSDTFAPNVYAVTDGNATIKVANRTLVRPACAGIVCPRDGELGCAYVDTLSEHDDVGKSSALLSCEFCTHTSCLVR